MVVVPPVSVIVVWAMSEISGADTAEALGTDTATVLKVVLICHNGHCFFGL
jgi:hypothetical protein